MDFRVRQGCAFVRIETTAVGWAPSESALARLAGPQWLHLEVDVRGARGVVADDGSWTGRVGRWVEDLPELTEVEVREEVALVTVDEPLAVVEPRLSELGAELLALYCRDGVTSFVVERDVAARFA